MRILSGQFKGRTLLPPPGKSITRPITGLVKKSLFDSLAPWLADAHVLDLYSGTGTMGLEAISRGASRCWFAEKDRSVIARLRRNIDACGIGEACTIWSGDIEVRLRGWLAQLDRPFDLAFLDPPYAHARHWPWEKVERRIFEPLAAHIDSEGLVILRVPSDVHPPETLGGLKTLRVREYGDMRILLLGTGETER